MSSSKKRRHTTASHSQAPSPVLKVRNKQQFESQVLGSAVPVMVDFWADWCGPCLAMAPEFEKSAAKWRDQVLFAKLNTEQVPAVAKALQITSIPTLLVFLDGKVIDVRIGASPASAINAMAQRALDKHRGLGFFAKLKRTLGVQAKAS